MRARDLQHVLAGLLLGHAELLFGGPALQPHHSGARREAALDRLAVERHRHLDVAAAVDMDLQPFGGGAVLQKDALVNRLVLVFDEQQRIDRNLVLFDETSLEDSERRFGLELEMRDLADAFALIEKINGLHGFALRGIEVRGGIARLRPLPA